MQEIQDEVDEEGMRKHYGKSESCFSIRDISM